MDMFLSPLLTSSFIKRCELLFVHDITQWSKRAGVADRATFAVINAAEGKISVGDVFIWEILWQLHLQIGVQSEPLMDSTFWQIDLCYRSVEHGFAEPYRQFLQDTGKALTWHSSDVVHLATIKGCLLVTEELHEQWIKRSQAFKQKWTDGQALHPHDKQQWIKWVSNETKASSNPRMRMYRIENLKSKYILRSEDVEKVWRANPLACAVIHFNALLARHQAGISLANFDLSITFSAYLYKMFKD